MQTQKTGMHLGMSFKSVSVLGALLFLLSANTYSKETNQKAAVKQISFDGFLQGTEIDTPQGDPTSSFAVDGSIPGLATHLSEFKLNYNAVVSLADGSAQGTGELIAADGDSVFVTISGQGEPTNTLTPNLNGIVEIDTITGGTGRFTCARGTIIVRRLIDLATGFTSGSVHGTILLIRK